jgi:lipopolysaccharide biosynthesis protein
MNRLDNVKRLCVFAHFDKDNIVDEYVLFYLRDIRKVAERIVFVSTSSLTSETISRLNNICDSVIIRKNEGYDFASWQTALKSETLKDFDELILCNDSVYGPLFSLEQAFSEMKGKSCDFWGMTSSHDIAYHVQSYFLVFRKNILASSVFQKFWESTNIPQSKAQVIKLCEIGLSQTLLNAGFKASTYARYRFLVSHTMLYRLRSYLVRGFRRIYGFARAVLLQFIFLLRVVFFGANRRKRNNGFRKMLNALIKRSVIFAASIISKIKNILRDGPSAIINFIRHPKERIHGLFLYFESKMKSMNITHLLWKQLVLYSGMPFIKVELLRDNPMAMNINDYAKVISSVSNYNIPMIRSHLSRVRNCSEEKDKLF